MLIFQYCGENRNLEIYYEIQCESNCLDGIKLDNDYVFIQNESVRMQMSTYYARPHSLSPSNVKWFIALKHWEKKSSLDDSCRMVNIACLQDDLLLHWWPRPLQTETWIYAG